MAKEKGPLIKRGVRVELNQDYYDAHDGRVPPFEPGRAYRILGIMYPSRPFDPNTYSEKFIRGPDTTRRAVILKDKDGKERVVDESYLAKPGCGGIPRARPPRAAPENWPKSSMAELDLFEDDDCELPFIAEEYMQAEEVDSEPPPIPEYAQPEESVPAEDQSSPAKVHAKERDAHEGGEDRAPENFGEYIRDYRKRKGIRAIDIAARMGVTKAYAYMLEKKTSAPNEMTFMKVADALGLEGGDRESFLMVALYGTEEPESKSFGQLLREHRYMAGMTRGSLSERIGKEKMFIWKIETGYITRRVPQDLIGLIADALSLGAAERESLMEAAGHTECGAYNPGQLISNHEAVEPSPEIPGHEGTDSPVEGSPAGQEGPPGKD